MLYNILVGFVHNYIIPQKKAASLLFSRCSLFFYSALPKNYDCFIFIRATAIAAATAIPAPTAAGII